MVSWNSTIISIKLINLTIHTHTCCLWLVIRWSIAEGHEKYYGVCPLCSYLTADNNCHDCSRLIVVHTHTIAERKWWFWYVPTLSLFTFSITDETLTHSSVSSVLNTVKTDQLQYWVYMYIPDSVRDKIVMQCDDRRDQCIHYWREISPYASWTWLAGRLHFWGESVAEAAAKRYFQRVPGVQWRSQGECSGCWSTPFTHGKLTNLS